MLITKALEQKKDLFLLNNDIIFTRNWLKPFESQMRAIRLPVSNAQYQYRNNDLNLKMSMTLEEYLGFEKSFEEIVESHSKNIFGLKLVHTAPYYCVHLPYSVLKTLGFFDEQFSPAGWEDTDYSVRSYLENIPIYYALNSFVLHFYGKSTWSIDGQEAPKIPKDHLAAKLFEKKWGEKISKLFGYQSEDLLFYMEQRLQRANILEISKIIESLKI